MNKYIENFFYYFEREQNPYPYAVFRILFYMGLCIHLLPALFYFDHNFSNQAYIKPGWSPFLWQIFNDSPIWLLQLCSVVTVSSLICGILGFAPRLHAFISGIGFYMFCSLNGINLQSLSVGNALGVIWLMFLIGDKNTVLSIKSLLRKTAPNTKQTNLLGGLILAYLCIGMFCAGIEKITLDWPFSNVMHSFLLYPKGFMLRDWAVSSIFMHSKYVGMLLSTITVIIELLAPICIYFKTTRIIAFIMWELFFLGIVITFAVPPQFYFIFAGGALLALEKDNINFFSKYIWKPILKRLNWASIHPMIIDRMLLLNKLIRAQRIAAPF